MKRTRSEVRELKEKLLAAKAEGLSQKALAERFQLSEAMVSYYVGARRIKDTVPRETVSLNTA